MKREDKSYKIIIDTNLWVSFLIGKHLKRLHTYIYNEKISIITCKEQVLELKEVFNKPKIKKYFSSLVVDEFFDLFDEVALLINITELLSLCRDPEDDYLLSLAIQSKADYLLTGDEDLLVIKQIGKTFILNFSDFENIIFL
jgi:putative PIN family toxin of toxin-antitoxin system